MVKNIRVTRYRPAPFHERIRFQSFPEMKTIPPFAAPEDYQIESEVMNAHQKSSIGNALIRTYMERDYIIPEKFEDFVYVGLVCRDMAYVTVWKRTAATVPIVWVHCIGN